jgi:hypothetical protein
MKRFSRTMELVRDGVEVKEESRGEVILRVKEARE